MRIRLLAAAVHILALIPFALPAGAEERVRLDLESSVRNRFVWRGEMWTDDPVFWQTAVLRWRGFRSWNFFNVDLTDRNNDKYELNEYDFILDYTVRFGRFSAAPGVLRFTSPTGFFKTTTKYTLDLKAVSPWSPRLRVRIDTRHSRGSYFIFSVARKTTPFGAHLPLDCYGEIGASQPRYYHSNLSNRYAFTDALLGVSVSFALSGGFTLSPFVEFTSLLDRSLRDAQDVTGNKKDAITFGVTAGKGLRW